MKILFDTQIFDWQINGGISRYFIEVINRLAENEKAEILFSCRHSYNTYIQGTPWLKNAPMLKNVNFKGKLGAMKIVNEKINRPYTTGQLKKGIPAIFHPTYYDPYFLKYVGNTPWALTVYDLTNEKYNDNSPLTQKVLGWKETLITKAPHIIAISENTKKDIIEYYKVSPDKITTVHLAGGFDTNVMQAPLVPEMKEVSDRYILFVGSRQGYKNFTGFIKEIAPVLIEENMQLVIAGGGFLSPSEQALINTLKVSDRIKSFGHISDIFLAQLYSKASLFVFPSLYEGFGLPVLEAMQCKCPALLSDNSSLPEVGGTAAAYFDPLQPGSLQQTATALIRDERKRLQMIAQGQEQVKLFNWANTAEKHLAVYQNMLS